MASPRIAFNNRMWTSQDLSDNPAVAYMALVETGWTSLAYGFGASGKLKVYAADQEKVIDLDRLYEDAVSLALGVFTIHLPHEQPCTRLICNCKIH